MNKSQHHRNDASLEFNRVDFNIAPALVCLQGVDKVEH